ncbi:MAG: pyruvate dehydrogenase complex dihydrolipoamide acetyltransferase, partial [Pyrinomonadaceae bacterium]|nr:pyruvate dehydrogenase complex dihydrolipoamide acetyltransferase [Pyrinomonadaceae bacterium]
MATQVVMPKLSPTMEEGQLSRWLKKEGDTVSIGETLAEVDTDKATMEMQALAAGVLRKILVQAGETVPLGQIVAIVGAPDEDISALVDKAAGQSEASKAATSGNGASQAAAKTGAEDGQAPPVKGEASGQDGKQQLASAAPAGAQPAPAGAAQRTAPQASGSAPDNGQRQASERIIISPL